MAILVQTRIHMQMHIQVQRWTRLHLRVGTHLRTQVQHGHRCTNGQGTPTDNSAHKDKGAPAHEYT